MTVVDDRIEMADTCDERTLDMMFEHFHTIPKDAEYRSVLSLDFGTPVDLTGTPVGLALRTDRFPRD
ncbi:hypothetical protein [Streptomyces sp. NPDC086010]|uniref:hypothetical protein n=1 Tax=Streptomyces sp. NPDC086010 TaxID=3365745 RepID=UPI0037D245E9